MCADPISLSFMAVSAGISAAGALSSGAAQASAHGGNAAMLESQARLRMEKADFDIAAAERRFRKNEGVVVARAASTGIDMRSFSDILADDASESALEREAIRWSAQNESNFLMFQSEAQRRQASDARTAGYFNAAAGVVNAFTPAFRRGGGDMPSARGITFGSSFSQLAPAGPARDLAPAPG